MLLARCLTAKAVTRVVGDKVLTEPTLAATAPRNVQMPAAV